MTNRNFRPSWAGVLVAGLAACSGCGGDDDGGVEADGPTSTEDGGGVDGPTACGTIRLTDDIATDTHFTADCTYVIPRLKQLFVQPGATLTIDPGTVIQGEEGAVLVITRGAKIMAEGTADAPIVFTSSQAEGSKLRGFWGGLLVLGAAPINNNVNSMPPSDEATFEAFTSAIPEGKFGGSDPNDNSGVLKYVHIEFGGFNFVADREFNNLTLCGVGNGTVVDYVQVHAGNDDGIELFGGTVNVTHIVSSQNGDDGFDTDNGWEGKAQFIIVQNVNPDGSREASNGYESDNHGTAASYTAAPRTLPTVYNVTILGKDDYSAGSHFAAVLRRGTGGHYFNHLITGFANGLEVRDSATADQLTAGNLFIKNSIVFHNDALGDDDNWPPAQAMGDIDEATYFEDAAWNNRFVDPGLSASAFDLEAPDFKPTGGAAALTGGATPPNDGFFDTSATFVGAVGADDWTAGWTSYPQPAL